MGDSFDLRRLHLQIDPITDGIVSIGLAEQGWSRVQDELMQDHQWAEQHWLVWHLLQAYEAFRNWNSTARLYLGREILGPSLDDTEVLSHQATDGQDY